MINRRRFLTGVAATPVFVGTPPCIVAAASAGAPVLAAPASRVRPGDPQWPSGADWDRLRQHTGGRLIAVQSPLGACREAPVGQACREFFREMKNPYYIGDDVALTQSTGWVDAWTSQPSVYAVAADTANDVAAAVNFAREHNLRLVVKGGGHSYLGTSNAPDSLLIWTRRMNAITLHDAFVPQGCERRQTAQPAVSVGAGAIWEHTYNAVTTQGGRYVQGGGCITVGVAGLVLGGGFGSYSKNYGTAAASLLEAEIVTADGAVRIANACTHFVDFYADSLMNPHWGEIVNIRTGRRLDIAMASQGLDDPQAEAIWHPFLQWVAEAGVDIAFLTPPVLRSGRARQRWDPAFLKARIPSAVQSDSRPGASPDNIFWSANLAEAGHFIHGYESVWLSASLLRTEQRTRLADALFDAGRVWPIELHFQKGLAGAAPEVIAAATDTATNPAVRDAFVLAIIGSEGPPAWPGLPGYAPDLPAARRDAVQIGKATDVLREIAPEPAAYVAESSFFQGEWQRAYWGENYQRLLEIKRRYDPSGLFFVHHGVGSEEWSEDGFTRLAGQ